MEIGLWRSVCGDRSVDIGLWRSVCGRKIGLWKIEIGLWEMDRSVENRDRSVGDRSVCGMFKREARNGWQKMDQKWKRKGKGVSKWVAWTRMKVCI